MDQLTAEDLDLILESLGHTKQAFTDYKGYPTYEFTPAGQQASLPGR